MRKLYKTVLLFIFGGAFFHLFGMRQSGMATDSLSYLALYLVGGLSFVLAGEINRYLFRESSLLKKSVIGGMGILFVELTIGYVLNAYLILGAIHRRMYLWAVIEWFILSCAAIASDDYLRHRIFGTEKPSYAIITRKKRRKKKRKTEFSKILVSWALVLTTLCVAISYGLSFLDHDPASDVTVTVAGACIAIAVAYEAKSFGEKNSRNKYGINLDEYKNEQNSEDDEDAVG